MSERWVSNKKYFCEYCRIYIADNKPVEFADKSRTLHETGLKHKGNIERHLTDVRKRDAEKRKQEEYNKRIVDQVERKALGVYSKETGTPYSLYSKTVAKPSGISERPSTTSGSGGSGLTTTHLLHSTQPVKINKDSGLGEWSAVEEPKPKEPSKEDDGDRNDGKLGNTSNDASSSRFAHLDHEAVYEEDVDAEQVSEFKISEKRAVVDDDVDETVTFKKKKKKVSK
ncbi:hypothetical protein BDR26DRAFT_922985 [Obelidium mucronatum]|nr:hypothetical protein BDR26DRAFT_922985 [Obelidium mucronatum]